MFWDLEVWRLKSGQSMSRFLISCGGTGGHLAPGIAVAEELGARGHAVRLLISEKRVDARLVEKYPEFEFTRVPGTGFSARPVGLAKFVISQARGVKVCRGIVREFRPDCVVGFGGFTSAGVVVAARMSGVPVALHESNRVPGRAVRVLGRWAQRVFLPAGVSMSGVAPGVVRAAGMPVRKEIVRVSQTEARKALGIEVGRKLVVVLGGSQGATVLNDWARAVLKEFAAEGVQICCVTGLDKGRDGVVELATKTGEPVRGYFLMFCDRIGELLSAADLAVTRAGAGTIAELVRCETPAVLVPFPAAADDHQRANAAEVARAGGGVVLEQADIARLKELALGLVTDEARLAEMRAKLRQMGEQDPRAMIVDELEGIAGGRR